MMQDDRQQDMIPRSYQTQLMKIAKEENSIIYLPTGSGKTYIAILLLKQMMKPMEKKWSEGGLIGIILVDTVPLVDQHKRTLELHTTLRVAGISGEMNVDHWVKRRWDDLCEEKNMFVMTSKILENALKLKFIDINRIHVLIFDECHHAVEAHTMREIMKEFEYAQRPPRVLGLTATLLNRNVKAAAVLREVNELEVSLHSKVASVDDLDEVSIHSTNPNEYLELYENHELTEAETEAIGILNGISELLAKYQDEEKLDARKMNYRSDELDLLDLPDTFKQLNRLILDTTFHIQFLGTYGGHRAIVAHIIQLNHIKMKCIQKRTLSALQTMVTGFSCAKRVLRDAMKKHDREELKIVLNSSPKVQKLFYILDKYPRKSNLPLCGLIFVERRFTAQILYHILKELSAFSDTYKDITCNYIVGYNVNPLSNTRYGLYEAKVNRSIINSFVTKKINLLVCSNLMEEGVDIPTCSLVIKFDAPNNYRSYVQSKGRTRHKEGTYVIMVPQADCQEYQKKMAGFQNVERLLSSHLVNDARTGPSPAAIQRTYNELELPKYYVNGDTNAAHVSMNDAVAMVHAYCNSLPSDHFTVHAPIWYMERRRVNETAEAAEARAKGMVRVLCEMPSVCPLLGTITGNYMAHKYKAKQAAALEMCIMLHTMGELDDHLMPKEQCAIDPDTDFLFTHWPGKSDARAGNTKTRRKYDRTAPSCMTDPLRPATDLYLHVIQIDPTFIPDSIDLPALGFHRAYSAPLCFAMVTSGPMPEICPFALYVSNGMVTVTIRCNERRVRLTQAELNELHGFHHLIFNDILGILHSFLALNTAAAQIHMLLAPIERDTGAIRWDVIREHKTINPLDEEPSGEEKANLVVNEDSYEGRIVSKWYRPDSVVYLVLRVTDIYPTSPFKTTDFTDFNQYFRQRYGMLIVNQQQPLLLVKAISKRLNCLKPRCAPSGSTSTATSNTAKRKRGADVNGDAFDEELVPEFVVKQEYPGALWIQAKLVPSVLHRAFQLIRAEVLRATVARETGLGEVIVADILPLVPDVHLLHNDDPPVEPRELDMSALNTQLKAIEAPPKTAVKNTDRRINLDVFEKKLENQYPWNESEEPVDIRRNFNVSIADIKQFDQFVHFKVKNSADRITRIDRSPAIMYNKDFVHKDIKILKKTLNARGPELRDIYKILASKKCNEIVNLERLETLGDSFLKLASSLYIWIKHPKYNEGKATTLKGKLISNKNLFYCGILKNLGSLMLVSDLEPRNSQYLPPSFALPDVILTQLQRNEIHAGSLFKLTLSREEQISGVLTKDSEVALRTVNQDEQTDQDAPSMDMYLGQQEVPDKTIADSVEAILGAYCEACGFEGGVRMLEWFGIIPATEQLTSLMQQPIPSPILIWPGGDRTADMTDVIDNLLPSWQQIETALGYHFRDRAFLLQALTHATFSCNRITLSYERLEFIGDAVLDYLVTMYIFEYGDNLSPGDLTDLRSALVNNETFAAFAVRLGLHKSMLYLSPLLQSYIEKYVMYMESVNYEINSNMLVFINDGDVNSAENIDVPKALGDIYESVIGAIYLDCGMDMDTVWKIVYKLMWKEIDLFSACVPKNPVRLLYEKVGSHPVFSKAEEKKDKCQMVVKLEVNVNAEIKEVHGYGSNSKLAKKAAAKIALCLFG